MKKIVITLVTLVLVFVAVIALSSGVRDELHWRWASYKNHAKDYAGYLQSWPAGRYVAEAERLCDDRGWEEAILSNTVPSFEDYLQKHLHGKYVAEARDRIDELRWNIASQSNTVESYQTYLQENPKGKHVSQAKESIQELYWKAAESSYTIASFEKYLGMYPQGKHASDAKLNISKLRELAKQNMRPLESNVTTQEGRQNRQKYIDTLFQIVQDPRYSSIGKDRFVKALPHAAALKRELLTRHLVGNVNRLYGWTLSENGNWTVKQTNDIIFEIVTKEGYDLEEFLNAIEVGNRP